MSNIITKVLIFIFSVIKIAAVLLLIYFILKEIFRKEKAPGKPEGGTDGKDEKGEGSP